MQTYWLTQFSIGTARETVLVFRIVPHERNNDKSFNTLVIIIYLGNAALYSALQCNSS